MQGTKILRTTYVLGIYLPPFFDQKNAKGLGLVDNLKHLTLLSV